MTPAHNDEQRQRQETADPVDPDDHDTPRTDKRAVDGQGEYEYEIDDPDVDFDPDDLTVQRDSDDNVIAQPVEAGSLGTIKVRPMAYGDAHEMFGDGQQMDIGPEGMAELFDRFIAVPDLDAIARSRGYENGLDAEYVKDMKAMVPRDFLMAVIEASGIDLESMEMDPEETRAQMQISGN